MTGKSGLFFNGMQQAQANAQAYDAAARQQLRALSLRLTGLPARRKNLVPTVSERDLRAANAFSPD